MNKINKKFLIISAAVIVVALVLVIWIGIASSVSQSRSRYSIVFYSYNTAQPAEVFPADVSSQVSEQLAKHGTNPFYAVVSSSLANTAYCVISSGGTDSSASKQISVDGVKYSGGKMHIDFSRTQFGLDAKDGTNMSIAIIKLNVASGRVAVKEGFTMQYTSSDQISSENAPAEIESKLMGILIKGNQTAQTITVGSSKYVILYSGKLANADGAVKYTTSRDGGSLTIRYTFEKTDHSKGNADTYTYPHVIIKVPSNVKVSLRKG